MQSLNCGIIGCGVIAPSHIESFQTIPGCQVRWLCDLVPEKTAALAEKYSVPQTCLDYRDMLADPKLDAVAVCTDHASHAQITADALNAGKHVLCEKALAASREGLALMFAARDANPGLVFSGIFQNRFNPIWRKLRELITDGSLGRPLTINLQMHCLRTKEYYRADDWRGTWGEEGGSLMINQAIHFVDILNWISGGITTVSANFANLTHGNDIETEDTVAAALQFNNGALGTIAASSSTSQLGWEQTLEVNGSEVSIDIRDTKILRVSCLDEARAETIRKRLTPTASDTSTKVSGKSYYGPGHLINIEDFVNAVREQREPFISADSARKTVETVLAIYESHREGRRISLS